MNLRFTVKTARALTAAGVLLTVACQLAAAERGGGLRQQPLDTTAGRRDKTAEVVVQPDPRQKPPEARSAPTPSVPGMVARPSADLILPSATSINHRGTRFLLSGGRWYEQRGDELVATPPPQGALLPQLPQGYSVRWVGGVPYFHSEGVYYIWRERQRRYEIVPSPPADEQAAQGEQPTAPDRMPPPGR